MKFTQKITGYGNLPKKYKTYETSKIVILPIPYDKTSTWGKGADKGPEAIIDASANMELYDIETDSTPYLNGIFTDKPIITNSSPDKMVIDAKKAVEKHLSNNKFVVSIGGEHSVTNGPVQAYSKKFKNLSVLQLDAHTDLRPSYHGSKYSHASIMSRVKELCPIVQVGIRSMDIEEKKYFSKDRIFFAKDIYNNDSWMDKAVSKLSKDVYITIDLDVFDPSILPSTGTPEPGGMRYYHILNFLKKVIKQRNVVGFDVVELAPVKHERSSDFLASKLIYSLLAYKFSSGDLK